MEPAFGCDAQTEAWSVRSSRKASARAVRVAMLRALSCCGRFRATTATPGAAAGRSTTTDGPTALRTDYGDLAAIQGAKKMQLGS